MSKTKLTEIRETFGISQAEMALVLGCSLSLYKMVEAGKRNLPEKSLAIFKWLETKAENEKANPNAKLPFTDEEKQSMVLEWESKKRKLEKAIRKLEKKHQQQLSALTLPQNFMQQFPETENGAEIKILESIKLNAEAALMDFNGQEILKLKLDLVATGAILRHLKRA